MIVPRHEEKFVQPTRWHGQVYCYGYLFAFGKKEIVVEVTPQLYAPCLASLGRIK